MNDPCATIATMVRNESRVYPQPTNIELFAEFKDIQLIHASTDARYLYSNLYMDEDHARSLVEWEEVEREENP